MNNITRIGDLVNLAHFGKIKWWSGKKPEEIEGHPVEPSQDEEGILCWLPVVAYEEGKPHIGVEWDEPREIYRIKVAYKDKQSAPDPDSVILQYWQNSWPSPSPERKKGARRGWIEVDGPWQGQWVTANTQVKVNGNEHTYIFEHLDVTELPDEQKLNEAEDYNALFRKTLKVRFLFKGDLRPAITYLNILQVRMETDKSGYSFWVW